ncbi:MAG: phage/plasmid primase, P4 family [Clostridia bacterium]|nr:phage/plasmid primase, P4 family [Clostridia bacterium]
MSTTLLSTAKSVQTKNIEPVDCLLSPQEFLQAFCHDDEAICLRVFDDRPKANTAHPFRGKNFSIPLERLDEIMPLLKRHNEKKRGIFFVVNRGGQKDADINRITAHFVENDKLPVDEQLKLYRDFQLPPSILVRTRRSVHAYWLMDKAEVGRFRSVQEALIRHFYGDKACANPSRVLRLPGFYHNKEEPVMVTCLRYDPWQTYTQDELLEALGAEKGIAPDVPDDGFDMPLVEDRKGLERVVERCAFIQYCRENAAILPEPLWYAMITNLASFNGGRKAIHDLSMAYPGYERLETERKIDHYLGSRTGPTNCLTLQAKGYTCPRRMDGTCSCRSPAAFAEYQDDIQELRAELKKLPLADDAVINTQTLRQFLRRNMAHTDPVLAASFIRHDIGETYHLHSPEVKLLIDAQRNLYKESKSVKTENDDLPAWYRSTESGLALMPGILADHMAKEVKAFYCTGSFFSYEDGVYQKRDDNWAAGRTRAFMKSSATTLHAIHDVVGQWRTLIPVSVDALDTDMFTLNLKNGLLDLKTMTLKPHTPEYLSTVQLAANYNPTAKCPAFLNFLRDSLPDADIMALQETAGYLLIPSNAAQVAVVIVGAANAGKSVLLYVLQNVLLGSTNVSNIPWQGLSERFNKAELFGKLANIFADLPTRAIEDTGLFKAMTGEDMIVAERKNKDPFTFRPHARMVFSCNEIPRNISDRSDGFYRRLLIYRFARAVPAEKRDPGLRNKLEAEADGILLWALEGRYKDKKRHRRIILCKQKQTLFPSVKPWNALNS